MSAILTVRSGLPGTTTARLGPGSSLQTPASSFERPDVVAGVDPWPADGELGQLPEPGGVPAGRARHVRRRRGRHLGGTGLLERGHGRRQELPASAARKYLYAPGRGLQRAQPPEQGHAGAGHHTRPSSARSSTPRTPHACWSSSLSSSSSGDAGRRGRNRGGPSGPPPSSCRLHRYSDGIAAAHPSSSLSRWRSRFSHGRCTRPRSRRNLRPLSRAAATAGVTRGVPAARRARRRRLPGRESSRASWPAASPSSAACCARAGRASRRGGALLAADFRGATLRPLATKPRSRRALLAGARAKRLSSGARARPEAFAERARGAASPTSTTVRVAELLITGIELTRDRPARGRTCATTSWARPPGLARRARGPLAHRLAARRDGAWRVVEWTRSSSAEPSRGSRSSREVTEAALGGERVLPPPARGPRSTPGSPRIDSVLHARLDGPPRRVGRATRTATVSTTSTSRSPRACPTGCSATRATAPSRTSRSRRGSACSTRPSQSLFADVDNDGDQDLSWS